MECDTLRETVEEEAEGRAEAQRHLVKVSSELSILRSKFDGEAVQRAEELEEARKKLTARILVLEEELNTALSKNSSLEKTKQRLSGECEDLMIDVERQANLCAALEKKQKNFDKLAAEWKARIDELTAELEASQRE
ncbi:hypothetical protein, partial [Salmonella sp. s51228]